MIRSRTWNLTDNVYFQSNTTGLPILYEFVSNYRRVLVVKDGSGYELRVSYKGIDIKEWHKRYGTKEDAIGWAVVQGENNSILLGRFTIKDFGGKRII